MSSVSSEPISRPGVPRVRLVTLLVLLGSVVLGTWALVHFLPLSFWNTDWVFGENSNQIFRADQLHAGKALYRDVDCQYGPLPIWIWYGFTCLAGNTISANLLFQSLLCIAFIGCLYWWLTQHERRTNFLVAIAAALLAVSFARTPYLHLLVNPSVNMEYLSFERFYLLALMINWRPMDSRGAKQGVWLALIFLIWQSSKVGGAFMALAAYGVMDILWLAATVRRPGLVRQWILWWCAVAAGLVAMEVLRCALFVITCGWELGMRAAWPMHVAAEYDRRWLTLFAGFRHFVAIILPILGPVILFLSFCVRLLRGQAWLASLPAGTGLLLQQCALGVLFYVISATPRVGYFGHEWHFFQYQWALLPFTLVLVFSVLSPSRAIVGLALIVGLHAGSLKVATTEFRMAPAPDQIDRLETRIGTVMAPVDDDLLKLLRTAIALAEQGNISPGAQTAASTSSSSPSPGTKPPVRSLIFGTWGASGWYVLAGEAHRPFNTFFEHPLIRRPADNEEIAQLLRETQILLIPRQPAAPVEDSSINWLQNVIGPAAWQQVTNDFITYQIGARGLQIAWEVRTRKPEEEAERR